MTNLISRQDTQDLIDEYIETAQRIKCKDAEDMLMDLADDVRNLPSAEPEIIRCKDCKHRSKSGLCNMWSVFGTVTTDDDMFCSYGERGDSDDE